MRVQSAVTERRGPQRSEDTRRTAGVAGRLKLEEPDLKWPRVPGHLL
jgi:hypothetical protein